MSGSIDVVVADESESVRLILASLLRADARFGTVTTVGTTAEVMTTAGEVDLVLTDLVLPDCDAFSLIDLLHGQRPELPVVVYTAVGPPYLRAEAASRGAAGYFTHDDDPDAVLDAIAAAARQTRSV